MIPAAPSAPIKNVVGAWNGQFALLEEDLKKWVKRMAVGQPPLTNTERIQLQSVLAATGGVLGTGPAAEIAAASSIYADKAAALSLKTTVDALPEHVLSTVRETAQALNWPKYGNPQAVAAVINGGIGQMTADWKNLSESQRFVMTQVVAKNLARGKGPRETGRALNKAMGAEFAGGQARSVMIARTTMAAAYDQSSSLVYHEAHSQGLITGWEWIASPGACPVCYELHGNVFPAEMPTYRHPNCRCATAPVTIDMSKAKKQFYEAKNGVELVTGKSGWTTWTKVKPGQPKTAPIKNPKAPVKAPDHGVDVVAIGSKQDGDVIWQVHEHKDGSVTAQAIGDKMDGQVLGDYWLNPQQGWVNVNSGFPLPASMTTPISQAVMVPLKAGKGIKGDAPVKGKPTPDKNGSWTLKTDDDDGTVEVTISPQGLVTGDVDGYKVTYMGQKGNWTFDKTNGPVLDDIAVSLDKNLDELVKASGLEPSSPLLLVDELIAAKKAKKAANADNKNGDQSTWETGISLQDNDGNWGINTESFEILQLSNGSVAAKSKGGSWKGEWIEGEAWLNLKGSLGAPAKAELNKGLNQLLAASKIPAKGVNAESAKAVKAAVKADDDKIKHEGSVNSPKGTVTAIEGVNGKIVGKYDGVDFTWDNQKGEWIHVPSGTAAGPNSTKWLNQAALNGDIDPPNTINVDKANRLSREKPRDVEADIEAGRRFKEENQADTKSPISGVTDEEWQRMWNDVSDGQPLTTAVSQATGWKTLWQRIRQYSGDYEKRWTKKVGDDGDLVMDAKSRKLFETAPVYSQPAYRGLDLTKYNAPFKIDRFLELFDVGDTLDLRGGSSFSFSKDTARGFGRTGEGGVMIHIYEGFTGVPIRGFSRYGSENEVLIASKLVVTDRYQTQDGVWHYIVKQEGRLYQ